MKKATRDDVLARITAGPVRRAELVTTMEFRVRLPLRKILEELKADGLIRTAVMGGFPHLVLEAWDFSPAERLAEIEGRCRRMVNGCLEWTGYIDAERGPIGTIGRKAQPLSVRRMVWSAKRKPLNFQQTVRMTCGNERCVEYSCMVLGTRQDKHTGRPLAPMNVARIAAKAQARGKLDWDKVRDIRARSAAGESNESLAKAFDVDKSTVGGIRRHESWRETGAVFTPLIPARAAA